MLSFKELNINLPILRTSEEKLYIHPSQIQQEAIPAIINQNDVLDTDRTKRKINNWLRERRINGHRNTSKKSRR